MKKPTFLGSERQKEIYLNGFAGKRSPVPVDWHLLEEKARQHMTPEAFAYIAGGAGLESTIASNHSAFSNYKIVPRMLRNVSERDMTIELFGQKIPTPLLLSPVGALEMVHPESDVAVGMAAAKENVPFIFSNKTPWTISPRACFLEMVLQLCWLLMTMKN